MAFLDALASFLDGSVAEVDGTTVGHVVACAAQRRVEPGRDPDGVDAERRQVADPELRSPVVSPIPSAPDRFYTW
ncbi:hypothetical protein ABGB07_23070 [Micromonosporaceae bacterium B7E4]